MAIHKLNIEIETDNDEIKNIQIKTHKTTTTTKPTTTRNNTELI